MTTLVLFLLLAPLATAANPLAGLCGPENLAKSARTEVEVLPASSPDMLRLRFPGGQAPGSLTLAVPPAGSDWTPYRSFTFEFRSSSTIGFQLAIRNKKGETFQYRVQPYQDVPVRAAISRELLTREYMNNRQHRAHWLSNWGNHIDLTQVESLTIRMNPNQPVTLEIGRFALTEEAAEDAMLSDRPVVDELGQWAALAWPGKITSPEQLRQAWRNEDRELEKAAGFGYSRWGGWRERKVEGTGFFRAQEIDGRWWLVDPDGHLFFSVGPDCVRYRDPTRATGRERLFARLPAGAGETADFYQANARTRHGETDFVANWKRKTEQRLKAWGFNTVANWSDPAMFEQPALPYVTNVSLGGAAKNWQRFPDVYSEQYTALVEADARRQCARYREDPYLIGYFIGNEPRWPQRNLIDLIRNDPEASATQRFVRQYLADHGDTPAAREALMETLSRRYFSLVREAIRKADPNHMVLGIRWAGSAPDPVLRANDVFDVFSINIYRFEPPPEQIERIYRLTRRPVLIGEFHFGAPERGYAPSLVMVKDQHERGVAYQYYVERAAALAPVVGAHWFQLCDQPVTGRFDGENYNLGLVTQLDLPYPEMVRAAQQTHRRIYQVHAGTLPATTVQARVR